MTTEETINQLKISAEELRNIDNIPENLSPSLKAILVEANQKAYKILSQIIELIENPKVGETKQTPKSLFP